MKTVILIDGAAGTGKSDLAKYLFKSKNRQVRLIKKYTTRKQRLEEKSELYTDLHFPADSYEAFNNRMSDKGFYWYIYGSKNTTENYYGIYEKDILKALEDVDFVVVIVRGFDAIQEIKKSLPNVKCVSVFVYTDRDLVVKRLERDGYNNKSIDFRLSRQPIAWADYTKNSQFYDEVIINSSDVQDFQLLIDQLFKKLKQSNSENLVVSGNKLLPLIKPLIGFKDVMQDRIREQPYDKNVFLMMKYRDGNSRVYKFIKRLLKSHGYNCVRADEPEWDITRNTYNTIATLYCCKYGIALFDEPEVKNDYSPNVSYELGMMHSQSKECLVLINNSLISTPFDLVKELYTSFHDNLELEEIIENWVKKLPLL